MTTLQLWQALRNPRNVQHPLFKRIHDMPRRQVRLNLRVLIGGSIIVGMLLVCGLTYVVPPQLIRFYAALPIALPLLYVAVVFGGTGRGVTLAGRISPVIAAEHENGTFETMAATREGKIGVYWTIINACVHRDANLEDTNTLQIRVTLILAAFVTFFLLIFYLNAWSRMAQEAFWMLPFVLYPLVAIYYIDYITSIVTGALMAALAAAQMRRPVPAQLGAVTVFVLLQVAIYLLTYGLAVQVVPVLFAQMGFTGMVARLSMAGMGVLLYFALREALNWTLWRALAWRLQAAPAELDTITQHSS
ncbi:MAG: hypothetical protein AAFU54_17610 [Chloroflexota bacterium]